MNLPRQSSGLSDLFPKAYKFSQITQLRNLPLPCCMVWNEHVSKNVIFPWTWFFNYILKTEQLEKKNKKEGKWINEVPGLHFWYTHCWLCNEMCVDHLYRRSSLQIICLVIYSGRYKMICIDCGAKKIGTTKFWVFLARYCSIPQGPSRACCISSAQIMTRPWLLISPFH